MLHRLSNLLSGLLSSLPPRLRGWRPSRRAVVIALACGVLLYGAAAAWAALTVRAEVGSLRALSAASIPELAAKAEDPALARSLRSVSRGLRVLSLATWPAQAVGLATGWLPGLGPRLTALTDSLALTGPAATATGAAADLLDAAREATSGGPLLGGDGLRLTGLVARIDAPMLRLSESVATLDRRRRALDAHEVGTLPTSVRDGYAQLDRVLPVAAPLADAIGQAPGAARQALGIDRPRTIALLGIERREMRGAGGFLGAVVLLQIDHGRVTSRGTYYSYAVDPQPTGEPVPQPLRTFMGATGFYVRDMTWFSDFPTAAALIRKTLERALNLPVDGIVAIDDAAMAQIIEIVGPSLTVDGFDQPLTAANLRSQLDPLIEPPSEESEHKTVPRVVGALGNVLLQAATRVEARRLLGQAAQIDALLRDRHVSAWFPDGPLATLIPTLRPELAGALRMPERGDYLFVTHNDIGWSWIFECMAIDTTYEVWLHADGSIERAAVTLRMENQVRRQRSRFRCPGGMVLSQITRKFEPPGDWEGTFSDYIRVYTPPGTTLVSGSGVDFLDRPFTESGAQVFAGMVRLRLDDRRTVRFEFTPAPGRALDGAYELFVPKQGGTDAPPFTLVVYTPDGTEVVQRTPQTSSGLGPISFYRLDQARDLRFRLDLRAP